MITALFLAAAAAALLYADKLKALWSAVLAKLPELKAHHYLAAALLAGAAVAWVANRPIDDGRPGPRVAPADLELAGLFTGPTAAEDAAALAALCGELAEAVQYDGATKEPRLNTNWQIADLRTAAREIRMAGQSIGQRQPLVRDAVQNYLDQPEILGKGGGPLEPSDRAKWIQAFRDISRAAEAAVR